MQSFIILQNPVSFFLYIKYSAHKNENRNTFKYNVYNIYF